MKVLRFFSIVIFLTFISILLSTCTMNVDAGKKEKEIMARYIEKLKTLKMSDEAMKGVPDYWRTGLDDIEEAVAGIRKGTVERICWSAGERPVYRILYGTPNDMKRTANLSSAMGAGSVKYYADKTAPDYRPTVYLVGAVHGGEVEGTAALMNIVAILETGKDLAGTEYPVITASMEKMNFVIILCANPDGRARVPLPGMVGLDYETFRYWSQGTWKDGTLAGWPTCKSVHPILNAVAFLGAYYNDEGINMMHDFFFTNPAAETKALLQTAEIFTPDFTILFHGGANSNPHITNIGYLFQDTKEKIWAFRQFINDQYKDVGFSLAGNGVSETNDNSFNLNSAITHVCGEPSITFESNQGLNYSGGQVKYTYDEIYRTHILTIEGLCKFILNNPN